MAISPTFPQVSLTRLSKVHPDLQRLMVEARRTAKVPFIITEGLRDLERQKKLKAAGGSQTLNSRHLTGHAVDIAIVVDGQVRWDWPLYDEMAAHIKVTAKKLGIAIQWGGDWKSLRDGPHFELTWKAYPL